MRLFVSYGHNDYPAFFEQLLTDLRKEHEVWADQELRLGDNWPHEIDAAISNCELFLFIKSKQSVRADSYCYGEIAYAREQNKRIAVLSLDNSPMPSIVSSVLRLNMEQAVNLLGELDDEGYDEAYEILREELSRFRRQEPSTREPFSLFSFDQQSLLAQPHAAASVPEKIIDGFTQWLSDDVPYMAVFGNAGSGKSTLAAELYKRTPLSAIHFFRCSNVKTLDARWYLQHLISVLSERSSDFRRELEKENFETDLHIIEPERLMREFLVRPLQRAGACAVLFLDGFDEIVEKGKRKEAADLFFGEEFRQNHYGKSIKVFVTSRNDRELKSLVASLGAEIVSGYEKETALIIRQVVEEFFQRHGYAYSEEIVEKIYRQSGGDLLYINFMLDEIRSTGERDVNKIKFPLGMKGVCQRYFDRIFESEDYYEEIAAPVLEILVSVKTPISVEELQKLCCVDRRELRKLLKKLEIFVDVRDNHVTFVHKSLYDWLIANEIMDKYFVDCEEGRRKLCDEALRELSGRHPGQYIREFGLQHLFDSEQTESIVSLMRSHEPEFNSIFLSFIVELVSQKQQRRLTGIFREYAKQAGADDYLTAETLRILVQFGCEASARKLAEFFRKSQSEAYYTKWIDLHAAKLNNASTSSLDELVRAQMEQTNNPVILADLKQTEADVLREQGNYDQAETFYEEALVLAEEHHLDNIYYNCEFALIDLLFVRGKLQSAWKRLDRLKEFLSTPTFRLEDYKYHRLRGHLFHIAGNTSEAFLAHQEALRLAGELHYPLKQMEAANSCAEAASSYAEGAPFLQISRGLFQENGTNKLEYGKSYYIASELLLGEKRYREAKDSAEEALRILTEVGYAGGIAHSHLERGKANFGLCRWEDAIADLTQALSYYMEKSTRPRFRFEAYAHLIQSAVRIGRLPEFISMDDLSYYQSEDYPILAELYDTVLAIRKEASL